MHEYTQKESRIRASIVISALPIHQPASNMSGVTQEKSRLHANIVKSALATWEIASNMNELTLG